MNRAHVSLIVLFALLFPVLSRAQAAETIYALPTVTVIATEAHDPSDDAPVSLPSFAVVAGPEWPSLRIDELPLHLGPPARESIRTALLHHRSGLGLTPDDRVVPLFTSFPALLTFDDGPNPLVTPELIGHLQRAGLTDTIFFFVGERMAKFPHLVRRVARAGFPIGYHSMTHDSMVHWSEWQIRKDIRRFKEVLNGILGYEYPLIWGRPPYGGIVKPGEQSLAHRPHSRRLIDRVAENIHSAFAAEDLGMMLWDVDTQDWKRPLKPRLVTNQFTPERRQIWLFHEYLKTDILIRLPDLLWRFQEMIVRLAQGAATG